MEATALELNHANNCTEKKTFKTQTKYTSEPEMVRGKRLTDLLLMDAKHIFCFPQGNSHI